MHVYEVYMYTCECACALGCILMYLLCVVTVDFLFCIHSTFGGNFFFPFNFFCASLLLGILEFSPRVCVFCLMAFA